ncbi:MAG TPA: hypothetical protein VEI82_00270 [Myxococcota bacterium]|nr:hypothetical protein [Myxococcota bacterium]
MAEPVGREPSGVIGALLDRERRLLVRLEGVLRFRREVYREIQVDPHAIPQAFAVVIATSALVGLGQGSLVGIFAGLGGAIALWIAATLLIWSVGRFAVGTNVELTRLLRCTGFAYVWFGLMLFASLPLLGPLFAWAALGLVLASLVVAAREVLETDTARALLVCAVALGVPLLALLWMTR